MLLPAILLAILQGLSEFLPISSDGHLALATFLMERSGAAALEEELFYSVVLHVATTLAVLVYFRRELWALRLAFSGRSPAAVGARRVVALVVAASVPTAFVGFGLKGLAEHAFGIPWMVGVGFLLTSAFVASTARRLRAPQPEDADPALVQRSPERYFADLAGLRWRDALLIGAVQGLAVWPGLSRSGTTIAVGVWLGLRPLTAARFSLLILLPAVGGAFLLKGFEVRELPEGILPWVAGFVVAFLVGWAAIGWLLRVVRSARLGWFAWYTAALALACFGLAVA